MPHEPAHENLLAFSGAVLGCLDSPLSTGVESAFDVGWAVPQF